MPDAPPQDRLVFQLGVAPDGKLKWSASIPLGELHLLLGRVQFEIVTGQVKQGEPAIVPADNGALRALDGIKNRMGVE